MISDAVTVPVRNALDEPNKSKVLRARRSIRVTVTTSPG
jgi:hypothetical protein